MVIKDPSFYKSIKGFLETYLMQQRQCSKHTQKSYRNALNLLLQYFKEELNIPYNEMSFSDLTYNNVNGFLVWLIEVRNCSTSTANNRLMAIKSFAKYTSIIDPERIYFQAELSNIELKKSPTKAVEFLSESALQVFLKQPDIKTDKGKRNFIIILLMYDTAARCSEIASLRVGDFNLTSNKPTVFLHGKGNKTRQVPISDKVAKHLQHYLDSFHPISTRNDENYMFYTVRCGKRSSISTDAISLFIKNYGTSARKECLEIPEHIHPHMIRHTRAMHLYRNGMPLVLLSEFLGHSNVNTTRIYAWADTEMKRKAIQKAMHEDSDEITQDTFWENDEDLIKRLYGLK